MQENNRLITTKKGKDKLPLFCGDVERVIPIYADQAVFGRDVLFNLASIVDQYDKSDSKQRHAYIDNYHKNTIQVRIDYAIGNLVYVEETCVYQNHITRNKDRI